MNTYFYLFILSFITSLIPFILSINELSQHISALLLNNYYYDYYPWRDNVNYHLICTNIRNQAIGSKFSVIQDFRKGGLGHKYVRATFGLTHAVLTKRSFKLLLPTIYSNSLNNCFTEDIITEKQLNEINYRYCQKCTNGNEEYNLSDMLGNQSILCNWCYMRVDYLYNKTSIKIFKSLGYPDYVNHFLDIDKISLRILLNPTAYLSRIITKFRQKYFSGNYVVGIQLKCSYNLTNTSVQFARERKYNIYHIAHKIHEYINSTIVTNKPIIIFVTSDISYGYYYLSEVLSSFYPVIESNTFHRGHSTISLTTDEFIKRAVMDIYLLAESDYIFISKSSYGVISCKLSSHRRCRQI